jgi:hypothetical protein
MITSDPLLATDQPRLVSRPHTEPIGSPSRPAKIQPWHLERLAVVYVRQSSPYQVMHNKESAEAVERIRSALASGDRNSFAVQVLDPNVQIVRSEGAWFAMLSFRRVLFAEKYLAEHRRRMVKGEGRN